MQKMKTIFVYNLVQTRVQSEGDTSRSLLFVLSSKLSHNIENVNSITPTYNPDIVHTILKPTQPSSGSYLKARDIFHDAERLESISSFDIVPDRYYLINIFEEIVY